jgi:hypothetical protein
MSDRIQNTQTTGDIAGAEDPRWRQRKTNFREFLESEVGTDTGPMRGREVLLEIA